MSSPRRQRRILPLIVFAQFAGTSLWFAGNAVLSETGLGEGALGWLTSSVQLGFILGTLIFAVLGLADRMPPRLLFLSCALLGGLTNALPALGADGFTAWLALRFATGFFLAGIYPVGMKIAASWYEDGLGRALGMLVGALVLGTAFPHLLSAGGVELPWRTVLLAVSMVSAAGGVMLYVGVPAGPHLPASAPLEAGAIGQIFANADFRAAALGYFGHMWELYAFWALVPVIISEMGGGIDVSLWSFIIIAAGVLGCVGGGWLSGRIGSARVAALQLSISGLCCLLAPALLALPTPAALIALVIWGTTVVGDSPQFSTLNAQTAPRAQVGTALTLVTSIGFGVTIGSIQLTTWLAQEVGPGRALWGLVVGPVFGVYALKRLLRGR